MESLSLEEIEIIIVEFKKLLSNYNFKEYMINEYERVIVVEDSLVLYLGIIRDNSYSVGEDVNTPKYNLVIEELIYNFIGWKYNHTQFINYLSSKFKKKYLSVHFHYYKFRGYNTNHFWLKEPTTGARVNELLPELKLQERYEQWEGIPYYFIVLEMKHNQGNNGIGVAYTKQKPHQFIVSKGKEVIKRGILGFGEIRKNNYFKEAFESWKGISRQKRLENHLEYF